MLSDPVPARYAVFAFVPASENSQPGGTVVLAVPLLASVLKSWVYAESNVVRLIEPAAPAELGTVTTNAATTDAATNTLPIVLTMIASTSDARSVKERGDRSIQT